MNIDKAIDVLEWWVATAGPASGGKASLQRWDPRYDQLKAREHQTRTVLAAALGDQHLPTLLQLNFNGDGYNTDRGIQECKYALGKLRSEAETEAILGSSAPAMSADAFHPLIWGAASRRWAVDHYSDAVQRAATFLNAHIQDLVGRHDVSDTELMREVFSTAEPVPGKRRLRWPGDPNDLTVRSMRVGILNLAQGAFAAIRNPATHATEEVARQEALEQLATLSMLARWIDNCDVAEVPSN